MPDVIILDLMMPEMDGFQLVAALQQHPQWPRIPVVVVTALDLSAEDRARLNSGVETILLKDRSSRPISLTVFVASWPRRATLKVTVGVAFTPDLAVGDDVKPGAFLLPPKSNDLATPNCSTRVANEAQFVCGRRRRSRFATLSAAGSSFSSISFWDSMTSLTGTYFSGRKHNTASGCPRASS